MLKYIVAMLVVFVIAMQAAPDTAARGTYGCAGESYGCAGAQAGCAGNSAGCSGGYASGCSGSSGCAGDAAGCGGASRGGLFRGRGPVRRFLFGR